MSTEEETGPNLEVTAPKSSSFVSVAVSGNQKVIAYAHRNSCMVGTTTSVISTTRDTRAPFHRTASAEKDPIVAVVFVQRPETAIVTIYENGVIMCHDETGQRALFVVQLPPDESKSHRSTINLNSAYLEDVPTCAAFDDISRILYIGTLGGTIYSLTVAAAKPQLQVVIEAPVKLFVPPHFQLGGGVTKLAVSSKYRILVVGDGFGSVSVYPLAPEYIGLAYSAAPSETASQKIMCIARLPPLPRIRAKNTDPIAEPINTAPVILETTMRVPASLDGSESGCAVTALATHENYLVVGYSTGHIRVHSLSMIPKLAHIASDIGPKMALQAIGTRPEDQPVNDIAQAYTIGLRVVPILCEIAAHVRSISCLAFCPFELPATKGYDPGAFYLASASEDLHVTLWKIPMADPVRLLLSGSREAADAFSTAASPASLNWSIDIVKCFTPGCGPLCGVAWLKQPVEGETATPGKVLLLVNAHDSFVLTFVPITE